MSFHRFRRHSKTRVGSSLVVVATRRRDFSASREPPGLLRFSATSRLETLLHKEGFPGDTHRLQIDRILTAYSNQRKNGRLHLVRLGSPRRLDGGSMYATLSRPCCAPSSLTPGRRYDLGLALGHLLSQVLLGLCVRLRRYRRDYGSQHLPSNGQLGPNGIM